MCAENDTAHMNVIAEEQWLEQYTHIWFDSFIKVNYLMNIQKVDTQAYMI